MIRVVSNVECFDTTHETPNTMSIESSPNYNIVDEWVEVHVGREVFRAKAQDLHDAIDNATRIGK